MELLGLNMELLCGDEHGTSRGEYGTSRGEHGTSRGKHGTSM
jgi:hypothetical protein